MDAKDYSKTRSYQLILLAIAIVPLLIALLNLKAVQNWFGGPAALPQAGAAPPAAKHKTSVVVVQHPRSEPDVMTLAKLQLVSGGSPVPNRRIALHRLPKVPGVNATGSGVTGPDGVVTLPLLGMATDVVLLAEFAGDEAYVASCIEIRCK